MIKFISHTRDTVDIAELALFTHRAYQLYSIPFKHGKTPDEIAGFFRKNCPDFLILARDDELLLGWAGLFYQSDSRTNLLAWYPLVIPFDPIISQKLVRECIHHCEVSGRIRMDVLLLNLTPAYRKYAEQCGAIYQAVGMKLGAEWLTMETNLLQLEFMLQDIPNGLILRPLNELDNDALWPCFDAAFANGADQSYAQQTIAQRRESYDNFFCRTVSMETSASLALIDGETIVGFVKIESTGNEVYVNAVGIIPAYRRQGLARYLLGTSMHRAAMKQHQKMILQVESENLPALGLYQELGFQHVNRGWASYYWMK